MLNGLCRILFNLNDEVEGDSKNKTLIVFKKKNRSRYRIKLIKEKVAIVEYILKRKLILI